jgi:hypothetical protein
MDVNVLMDSYGAIMPKNVFQTLIQSNQVCLKLKEKMTKLISKNVKWAVIFVLIQKEALAYNVTSAFNQF